VSLLGHRHPAVVEAAQRQSAQLVHAMGDAFPDVRRIALLEALAGIAPPGLEVAILGLSGSDAIDAAIKTAVVATGRTGVVVVRRGYHGLALGVVGLQTYAPAFTEPFRAIAHPDVRVVEAGCTRAALQTALAGAGLLLVEPIQGRGGMHPLPEAWLAEAASTAREAGALVAFDEIQSGMGRTGAMWAGPFAPDLLCVGKALAGGFPLSACLGTAAAMRGWADSTGEALHTQTFLGHPVGCAAALAVIATLGRERVIDRCRTLGLAWEEALVGAGFATRGRGLMRAVEVGADGLTVSRALGRRGWIAFPAGPTAIGLTPSIRVDEVLIAAFVETLREVVA
jgi:acetylornithine/succinyldiaminopimelate/putrescine aminotransferase